MSASILSREITDLGIKIKNLLSIKAYADDVKDIDYFLCQYNYISVQDKETLTNKTLSLFDAEKYKETVIEKDTLLFIEKFCNLLKDLKNAIAEIESIPFDNFLYNGKNFNIRQAVFNWILNDSEIIFLIQQKGKFIEDNLVALDYSGNILWSSKDSIKCLNRVGAVFVGIGIQDENTLIANAYVGINYYFDMKSGAIKDSLTVK